MFPARLSFLNLFLGPIKKSTCLIPAPAYILKLVYKIPVPIQGRGQEMQDGI